MTNLIHLAANGDHAAFAELVLLYRPMSMRVAQQILRTEEAAADAVQDAMIKVWIALPNYQDGNFQSWLMRIVANTSLDHLRRAKVHHKALSLDELMEATPYGDGGNLRDGFLRDDTPDLDEQMIQRELLAQIYAAIDTLPAYHRNVVLLVDVDGLDYAEAAQHEGVPLGTVKSRLSRGRAVLRERIAR